MRRRAVEKGERWNKEKEDEEEEETMPLKNISCLMCGTTPNTRGMKLRVKMGFSSIKCKSTACGKVAISSTWRCRCRRLWIKCPVHVHGSLHIKKKKGLKRQMTEKEKTKQG